MESHLIPPIDIIDAIKQILEWAFAFCFFILNLLLQAWPILLIIVLIEIFQERGCFLKLVRRYNGRIGRETYIDENGYRRFSDSDKLVSRWVAEKKIGRKLDEEEVVHHRNEDKLDNRPSNLDVLPNQEEHNKLHGYDDFDEDFNDDDDDL
jgi:hypothetical protein